MTDAGTLARTVNIAVTHASEISLRSMIGGTETEIPTGNGSLLSVMMIGRYLERTCISMITHNYYYPDPRISAARRYKSWYAGRDIVIIQSGTQLSSMDWPSVTAIRGPVAVPRYSARWAG